jgi:xanthine dehydrogenase accessory factor
MNTPIQSNVGADLSATPASTATASGSTTALDVLSTAQRLQQQDQPFALVSVLRVQAPASARPGDKAVVTADGIVQGWIGGGCAQPAVQRTVRLALADGRARMIRIAPDATAGEGGAVRELGDVLEFGMACHSGGTLELFVDPVLPRARLTVIGDSPVAVALADLAPRVGLQVSVIAHGVTAERFVGATQVIGNDDAAAATAQIAAGSFVVVATQGRRDVQGLRAALALGARQVWFVASARKAEVLKGSLVAAGHDAHAVAAIVAPAGQAIGAYTPEEVALSVLAAVVAARRQGSQAPVVAAPAAVVPAVLPDVPPARPRVIAPLPDMPDVGGSCCGGAAKAAEPVPEPAPIVRSSCCGG